MSDSTAAKLPEKIDFTQDQLQHNQIIDPPFPFETVSTDELQYLWDGIAGDGDGLLQVYEGKALRKVLDGKGKRLDQLSDAIALSLKDEAWRAKKGIDTVTWTTIQPYVEDPQKNPGRFHAIKLWVADYIKGMSAQDDADKVRILPHWTTYGGNEQTIYYYTVEPFLKPKEERNEIWCPADGSAPSMYADNVTDYVRRHGKKVVILDRVDGEASEGDTYFKTHFSDENWDYNTDRADAMEVVIESEKVFDSTLPVAMTGHSSGNFWKWAWDRKYGDQHQGQYYFLGFSEDSGLSDEPLMGPISTKAMGKMEGKDYEKGTYSKETGLPSIAYKLTAGGNMDLAQRYRVASGAASSKMSAYDWHNDDLWTENNEGYYHTSFSELTEDDHGITAPTTYIVDINEAVTNRDEQINRFTQYHEPGSRLDFYLTGLKTTEGLSKKEMRKRQERLTRYLSKIVDNPTQTIDGLALLDLREEKTLTLTKNGVEYTLHFYPSTPTGHLSPYSSEAREILWKQTLAYEDFLSDS